jgi:large subunit ribosomal protein L10
LLRAQKVPIVESLHGVFEGAGCVVVTHYKGLTVAEIGELRRQMREAGATFRVTKNRLAKIALADTPFAPLESLFEGPTAVALSADPVAAPKAVTGFAKKNDKLKVVGGGLADHLLSAEDVKMLADLPPLDELRAKLLSLLNTPAARLVGLLQAPGGQLARVLAARAEAEQQS